MLRKFLFHSQSLREASRDSGAQQSAAAPTPPLPGEERRLPPTTNTTTTASLTSPTYLIKVLVWTESRFLAPPQLMAS